MKKFNLITFVLIILLSTSSFAQEFIIQVRPMDSKDWGYVNLKGDYILSPQFRKCYDFSDNGYALIYDRKEGFYFINTKGEKLQTEVPDYRLKEVFGFGAKGFIDGYAAVLIDKKWGYMNTEGKLVIPAKYDKASIFENGFAIAQINDEFYIIDQKGNAIEVTNPNIIDIKWFSEGVAPFKNEEGVYGFINGKGEIVINAQFLSVGYFNSGLAWAKTPDETIGFINTVGEWVIQPQFEKTYDFDPESGMARVLKNKELMYINTKGETLRFSDSEYISDFHEGLAKGKKNDKLGFYDKNLNWVIQPQFDGVRNFKNGYAAVKIDDKWGIIDRQGNWIIQPMYEAIRDVEKIN